MDIVSVALQEFGIQLKRSNSNGKESWHGSCPFEQTGGAGTDRFTVFPEGNYFCRACGAKGWLRATPQRTPQEIAEFKERRKQEEEIWRKKRLDELAQWKLAGHEEEAWQWHENNHMDYWLDEGVPEWAIYKYRFGYCESKSMKLKTGEFVNLPVYTMPIWTADTRELVNIQYRLCDPPLGEGKYRQEPKIPAAAAFMDEDYDHQAIFVEGYKKAVIVYDFIDMQIQVVGFPSNLPSIELLNEYCSRFKKAFIIFDPGSDNQIKRMGKLMPGRAWAITMPVKVDDAIVKFSMNQSTFRSYFTMAERLK